MFFPPRAKANRLKFLDLKFSTACQFPTQQVFGPNRLMACVFLSILEAGPRVGTEVDNLRGQKEGP